MRIDFFEEFPTVENFRKAELIDFESTIYIAAKSLKQFYDLKKQLNNINPSLEAAYWPTLEKSYWISPFSRTYELENLIKELLARKQNDRLKVLIDLELPILNKKLFVRNLGSFLKNKILIGRLFKLAGRLNIEFLTAEYPVIDEFSQKVLKCLGVSYSPEKYPHKKIVMLYSSLISNEKILRLMKDFTAKKFRKYGQNLQVGLGTIATGILGNEPILSPKKLDRDLNFLRENGIETAVIFRLGGLNEKYLEVIEKYV